MPFKVVILKIASKVLVKIINTLNIIPKYEEISTYFESIGLLPES